MDTWHPRRRKESFREQSKRKSLVEKENLQPRKEAKELALLFLPNGENNMMKKNGKMQLKFVSPGKTVYRTEKCVAKTLTARNLELFS